MKKFRNIAFLFLLGIVVFSCKENTEQLTIDDYKRAESFLRGQRESQVIGSVSGQWWQKDGNLIYSKSTPSGREYLLADLKTNQSNSAFDHDKLANSLNQLSDEEVDGSDLLLSNIRLEANNMSYRYSGTSYKTNLEDYTTVKEENTGASRNEIESPDGKKVVYIKGYNLWMRNVKTNKSTQLTFDGIKDYGYATNNAGWLHNDSPVLLWSPNSDKIATFRHDGRGVGDMYLYNTAVGHSELKKWKYPLPGDSLIFRIERIVIDLSESKPSIVKLDMGQDPHRSTTSDHIAGRGGVFLDVEWNNEATVLSFVTSSRDHKIAHLQISDPVTGDVRSVHREEVATYYEGGYSRENWRVLNKSNEFIWFSEKSNWGHLYLHDLATGKMKNAITSGDWAVLDLKKVDEANRVIYFTGSNKEEGDPYYQYLYKVSFDGTGLTLLTPELGHHSINWSVDKNYFTDSYSTPNTAPTYTISNLEGEVINALGKADISALIDSGWVAPIPFSVKARDEMTDLYGLMYKPSNFDASKKYPILNYLYPGPQSGSVGSRSFRVARSDKQAVAELGFIVVELDAMGTPGRSKSFHDAYYGNMGDNGLPDQITAIKQLAAKNPWMDIDKVGIWGHSGGGFASTAGVLRYPEFYKVAVSSSGNHDNRNYEDDWGEKWHGLLTKNKETNEIGEPIDLEVNEQPAVDNYDKQANQLLAENLQGKLLLAHGLMDDNVPPTNTLLVAEALMTANKEFDMLLFPNARHGYGQHSKYFAKKRWNYFIEHLQGRTPLFDFAFEE